MAALQAELGAHVGAVIVHRARAETEFIGDFLAGFVGGDEFENAALGRREAFQARRLLELLMGARTAVHPAMQSATQSVK